MKRCYYLGIITSSYSNSDMMIIFQCITMWLLLHVLTIAPCVECSIFDDHQLHPRDGFRLSVNSPREIAASSSRTTNAISTMNASPSFPNQQNNNLNDIPVPFENNNNGQQDFDRNEHTRSIGTNRSSNHSDNIKHQNNRRIKRVVWKDVTKSIVPNIRNSQTSILRRLKRGRITCDFGSYTHQPTTTTTKQSQQTIKDHQYFPDSNTNHTHRTNNIHPSKSKYDFSFLSTSTLTKLASSPRSTTMNTIQSSKKTLEKSTPNAKIRVTVDPSAIGRLSIILLFAASSFGSAFMGTLRLLAPLVVSRRILVFIGTLISDWYAGRYFRETFTRIEQIYIHYYETPATFRALSRSGSQFIVYLTLARIMGWLVGISHPPCRSEGRGLAFFCGLLWLGSVVGTGHAFSTAVALWGGPLRLQAANHPTKPSVKTILRRPWHIFQWMQNPEQWISLLSIPERRPFDPNPIAFPVTWPILRLVQMIGVAKAAASEPSDYLWWCPSDQNQIPKLMKQYLIQLALCDEWCRVFIKERRLGLGIFVACAYAIAMCALMVTCAGMDGTASLLLLPSLLALIVSTWLNLVLYCNRYIRKRKKPVFTPISSL